MRIVVTLCLWIVLALPSFAIDGLLVKTIDYTVSERWKHAAGISGATFHSVDTVYKGQTVYLSAVAWDFALNDENSAAVTYAIKVLKPDNGVYFSQKNLPILSGTVENKNLFMLSSAVLSLVFDNKDSFGEYKIELQITDQVSGASKDTVAHLTLAPLPLSVAVASADAGIFSKWIMNYFNQQKPVEALSFYLAYAKTSLSDKENSFWPVFSIFREIFSRNTFLLPQVIATYRNEDFKAKTYLLYLMEYAHMGAGEFFKTLKGEELAVYEKIKSSPSQEPYGEITDAVQLDMLWGIFFASGSYRPVKKLIETLDYARYRPEANKFRMTPKSGKEKTNDTKASIYRALVWSIESNVSQYPLVAEYCNWALQNEQLTPVQRAELRDLFIAIKKK
jgi:hypothetical protein